jgi:DNA-directed RNA polymerase subunit F
MVFGSLHNDNTNGLFLFEVFDFLEKRIRLINAKKIYKSDGIDKNTIMQKKTFEFLNRMCSIEKNKIIKLRLLVNKFAILKTKNEERQLKIEIILCKIIDLYPINFNEIRRLFPNCEKVISSRKLREFFREYYKINNEID